MGMLRDYSAYVITDPCIDLKDATCLEVCPVDCIESTASDRQYYINPDLCIVCEQCVLVCPVDAIMLEHEVPEKWKESIERNAAFFREAAAALPAVSDDEARGIAQIPALVERGLIAFADKAAVALDQRQLL